MTDALVLLDDTGAAMVFDVIDWLSPSLTNFVCLDLAVSKMIKVRLYLFLQNDPGRELWWPSKPKERSISSDFINY